MEIIVRLRLSYDSNRPLWGQAFVAFHSYAEAQRYLVLIIVPLGEQCGSIGIEAGVRNRKDEAAIGLESPPNSTQQRRNAGDVHQRHVADCRVKFARAKGGRLVFPGQIHEPIVDSVRMFAGSETGAIQERAAEITGDDVCAQRREAPRELSVSAGQFEDSLTGLNA